MIEREREAMVAKDKKAKKKTKPAKAADTLKSVAMNPMVQEVVAAALVATAAALKDSKKARAMAEQAGDQIEKLAGEGAQKGKALWALALEVARRAGDIVQEKPRAKPARAAKPATAAKKPAKAAKAKKPARKAKAQK
jgi:hypothetical protein